MATTATREQMGVELARLCVRLDCLKESKKEEAARAAADIKSCEKEIKRLSLELRPGALFKDE